MKLELRPANWKARLWRAFDDSTMSMLRLAAPLELVDVADHDLNQLLAPFRSTLRGLDVYLERGAGSPLPLPWSVGWLAVDAKRPVAFLHRVLDDPFGNLLATLFREREVGSDLSLVLSA